MTSITAEKCQSVKGSHWVEYQPSERDILTLQQKFDLPEILARIVCNRGISLDNVPDFLQPTIRNLLPDPFHLRDMEKAVLRINSAIKNDEKIAIFGDYDVDGATSSSLLKRYFRSIGVDVLIYIPDRMKEGYGPNSPALLKLKEAGVDVCITVDCGILAFEPLAAAKKAGLDMIVVDHHLGAENLPDAIAIVNPNRLDETSEHGHMAAVGVSFLLCVAINSYLKKQNYFRDKQPSPNLIDLLDIVALGTVCDVVPLKGVNRAFVSQGLKIMRKRQNVGICALSDIAAIDDEPSGYHLGFVIGPRINAGGRVGKSSLGARILSTNDRDEAARIATQLDRFNKERKTLEDIALQEAILQIESEGKQEDSVIFAVGKGWHAGVIGIVSSRITERYNRPSAIIAVSDGIGKASARSISGIDFGSAVVAANQSGLLIAGGGHAMAAGFSVAEDKINDLHDFLKSRFAKNIEECAVRRIKIDANMSLASATLQLAESLETLSPFGIANPEPRFIFNNVRIVRVDVVGKDHVRCILANSMSGGMGGSVKAMAFRCLETELGDALLNSKGRTCSIVGKLKVNSWQGSSSAQIIIDDIGF